MNEIIAAIVGAVITGIIAFIAYIYKSRQGNRIIVKRISETPQIDVSRRVKRNLAITYNNQPVDNLVLNTLVVHNNGNEIIKPVEFKLEVTTPKGEIDYLEVEEDDPLGQLGQMKIIKDRSSLTIKRPYLNPKKKFKEEEIKLAVFSNTRLDFSVEGGGEGWYAKFEDEITSMGIRFRLLAAGMLAGFIFGLFALFLADILTINISATAFSTYLIIISTVLFSMSFLLIRLWERLQGISR
jgi:hypothetical protein